MFDVIIVGAGLVGCLSALLLSDRGYRCIIIEQNDPLDSASQKSAGGIYLQLQSQITALGDLAINSAIYLLPLIRETYPAWLRLQTRLPKIPLEITGGIIVAFTEDELQLLKNKNVIESQYGINSTIIDAKTIQELSTDFNPSIIGGSYAPEEGHCHPPSLLSMIFAELKKNQVEILTHTKLIQIFHGGTEVTIKLNNAVSLNAKKIIFAAGSNMGSLLALLGISHSISSLAIQMFALKPAKLRIPLLTRYAGVKLSVKQLANKALWIGGGWPAKTDHTKKDAIEICEESFQKNFYYACKVFPKINDTQIDTQWAGQAAWTTDGLPVIGVCPGFPDILLACGGNGFSLAPLFAELLTKLVIQQELPFDLAPFSLSRLCNEEKNVVGILPY